MKRRTLVKAIGTAGIAASLPFHVLGNAGEKKMKVLFMGLLSNPSLVEKRRIVLPS